jgi:hypothetical protein
VGFAEHSLTVAHDLLAKSCGGPHSPGGFVGVGEMAPRTKAVKVVGAKDAFTIGQCAFVECDGVVDALCGSVRLSEMVAGGEGIGVVGAEESLPVGQGAFVQGDGFLGALGG